MAAFKILAAILGFPANTPLPTTTTPSSPPGNLALGAGALIVALLGAPFLIWRAIVAQTTVDLQKEGLMTDRISKAVEHLAAEKTVKIPGKAKDDKGKDKDKDITIEETRPNIEVRIGGLLALERIAQDSVTYDKGRDHVRVMEILCAYVRENAPARKPAAPSIADSPAATRRDLQVQWNLPHKLIDDWSEHWDKNLVVHPQDIAITLRIIGRRTEQQKLVEAAWPDPVDNNTIWPFERPLPFFDEPLNQSALPPDTLDSFKKQLSAWKKSLSTYTGYRLDLRGANLQNADLAKLCFSGARLANSQFDRAEMRQTRLVGAKLQQARLNGANLREAYLQGATLNRAHLEKTILQSVRLDGAEMMKVSMLEVNLSGALLNGADLSKARIYGNMNEARMLGAILTEADFSGTDLSNTRFDGAMCNAPSTCKDVVMSNSALHGVDVSKLELSLGQINSAFGDASVILPDGIVPNSPSWPDHWPKQKLEPEDFQTAWRNRQANPET